MTTSLLARFLDDRLRVQLAGRTTSRGVRLQDVIRSGLRHPDSSVGVYAPDAESYATFRELFDPILDHFRPGCVRGPDGLACIDAAAVVSTRVRIARNLAGHAFPAGMRRSERLAVEARIARACEALARRFAGLAETPLAFGPDDRYMAAAGIHDDWPTGRRAYDMQGRDLRLSVWINEEDHLRVAVVMPGACIAACCEAMSRVMSILDAQLTFCVDARIGHLTSCPSNAGAAMRASYRADLRLDAARARRVRQLEAMGLIQVRGAAGEHAPPTGGIADIGLRHRVGVPQARMLRQMEMLIAQQRTAAAA